MCDCGLVQAERDGRFMRYSLSMPAVDRVLDVAEEILAIAGTTIVWCPNYGQTRER